ncbi:MAG: S-layer homology domain-containing protein, partial [Eubacterium sp.]|nr:S-layer homology domain-containing protein [Eubacterium sp.]
TFLFRYYSSMGYSSNVTSEDYAKYKFSDVPANAFYYEPITWAAKNGITSGISDTVFGRGRSCTRSQMVSFLQRFSYYCYPYQNPDYFGD